MEGAGGGLHKRSAEDWGDSLRAPGAELLRKAWFPWFARVSAKEIAFGALRGVPAQEGAGRRRLHRRLELGRRRPTCGKLLRLRRT